MANIKPTQKNYCYRIKMENEEESNDWTAEIIRTLIRSVCVLWNGDFQVSFFCYHSVEFIMTVMST